MKKKVLIYCLLLSVCIISGFSRYFDNDNDLRTLIDERGQAYVVVPRDYFASLPQLTELFSISDVDEDEIELCVTPFNVDRFIGMNLPYKILYPSDTKSALMATSLSEALQWQSYPTYEQYDSIMHYLADRYPELCMVDTIGTSVNGKLIFAIKISDDVSVDDDEPEVFYSSTMHGDELAGYVLMMRLSDYLLSNYYQNDRVRNLVDNLQIYIAPLTNPDGVSGNGNVISTPTRSNANGYDLNRNFPDIIDDTTPHIQPETESMITFMQKHKFVISANFHSGVEVVNYPWDRISKRHADDLWFYEISRAYVDTVHFYSPSNYMTYRNNGVTNGYQWYMTSGSRQDYITFFLQGREVTIELDNTKQTDASMLDALWTWNRSSFIGYLDNALFGLKGVVTDSKSHSPINAKITVVDYDDDYSFVYSDDKGIFRRMLPLGSYTLKVSAEGYYDKNVEVSISDRSLTELFIELDEIEQNDDDLQVKIFPNPVKEDENIIVEFSRHISTPLVFSIYNVLGAKLRTLRINADGISSFRLDTNYLRAGMYILSIQSDDNKVLLIKRFVIIEK